MKRVFVLLIACAVSITGAAQDHAAKPNGVRMPYGAPQIRSESPGSAPKMLYHGGPVMLGTNHIYVIYYGRFRSTTADIIDTFLENVGGSGAFNVNTTYFDGEHRHISNALTYVRASDSYYDNYSMGHTLKGNFDTTEVSNVLQAGHLPTDSSGIYILITSPDVKVPMGTYCGYHFRSGSIVAGYDIKYAVIPDITKAEYGGCSGNVTNFHERNSPNDDIGADEVTDTAMHELSETVTDPDVDAWFTYTGYENGDLCSFEYGTTFIAPNGTHANQVFGDRNYLVQTIWQNTGGGFCANSLP